MMLNFLSFHTSVVPIVRIRIHPAILLFLLLSGSACAQLYTTLEDFLLQHPDTAMHFRKIDDVRVDTLIERCWFSEEEDGMVKHAFAIQYQDRLYISERYLREHLPSDFHPHADQESNVFYPVLDQGRYLYLEIISDDRDPALSIAMGLLSGPIGNAAGLAVTPPVWHTSAVVMDSLHGSVYGFDSWKEVQAFLKIDYPDQTFIRHPAYSDLENIRRLFSILNLR